MAIVNQMVQTQATLLAYIDVFVALGVIGVLVRNPRSSICYAAPSIVSMKPFADARSKSDLWG
jgi:hypothetical protein